MDLSNNPITENQSTKTASPAEDQVMTNANAESNLERTPSQRSAKGSDITLTETFSS